MRAGDDGVKVNTFRLLFVLLWLMFVLLVVVDDDDNDDDDAPIVRQTHLL